MWLPFFEPAVGGRRVKPAEIGERKAVVAGVGQSQIGRRIYRDPLDLTIEACLAAIEDAGLTRDDIDGLATYPGNMAIPPGFSGVGVTEIQDALRLNLNWFAGGLESPGQLGSVANAVAAVATGLANHVLCFRTVWEASAQGDRGRAVGHRAGAEAASYRATGFMQWTLPVRRAVRRQLDRDDGAAPLPRVRHHPRAARPDRARPSGPTRRSTRTRSTATR